MHMFRKCRFDHQGWSANAGSIFINTMFGLGKGKRKEGRGRDFHCLVSRVERKLKGIEEKRFLMGPQILVYLNWPEEQWKLSVHLGIAYLVEIEIFLLKVL